MGDEWDDADVELAIRAVAGDEVAFVEIVRRYDHGLRRLAFRLLGDRDAMDDVLQEAILEGVCLDSQLPRPSVAANLALPHRLQRLPRPNPTAAPAVGAGVCGRCRC